MTPLLLLVSAVVFIAGSSQALYTKMACEYEWMNLTCLDDQQININSVDYGRKNAFYCNTINTWTTRVTNCTAIDSSFAAVRNRCEHKKACNVFVSYDNLGGDPCAYVQKYLEVSYDCVKGDVRSKYVCDSEKLTINCGDKKIHINDATYGRTDPIKCLRPQVLVNTNTCRSSNSTAILASRCDGKTSCETTAGFALFGDPCPRIGKFLEVKYVCK